LGTLIVQLLAIIYINGIVEFVVRLTLEVFGHAWDFNQSPALRQFFIQSRKLLKLYFVCPSLIVFVAPHVGNSGPFQLLRFLGHVEARLLVCEFFHEVFVSHFTRLEWLKLSHELFSLQHRLVHDPVLWSSPQERVLLTDIAAPQHVRLLVQIQIVLVKLEQSVRETLRRQSVLHKFIKLLLVVEILFEHQFVASDVVDIGRELRLLQV
jgi:hypothetical protein